MPSLYKHLFSICCTSCEEHPVAHKFRFYSQWNSQQFHIHMNRLDVITPFYFFYQFKLLIQVIDADDKHDVWQGVPLPYFWLKQRTYVHVEIAYFPKRCRIRAWQARDRQWAEFAWPHWFTVSQDFISYWDIWIPTHFPVMHDYRVFCDSSSVLLKILHDFIK